MNLAKRLLLASAVSVGAVAAAQAADLPTKKAAPVAPPPIVSCTGFVDFITTACPLTYGPVTVYGTIDIGAGYEKFGAPFDPYNNVGLDYLIQKPGHPNLWALSPSGLSQSNVGANIKQDIGGGWSLIAKAEIGFDPYSLQLANGPRSQWDNNLVKLPYQTANGDSSRAGQLFNSQVFAGFSNATFGTLTYGRQNTLDLDGVNAYDPMGGSYAFSPIGYSGAAAGTGDTEDARSNSAFKYRVAYGQFHAAAMAQVGGYAQGNGSTGLYQGQIGATFNGLSVDAIFSRIDNAVGLGTYNGPQSPDYLKGTVSNNESVMLLAKYTWNQFNVYGGYENINFTNPSSEFANTKLVFTDIGGYPTLNQGFKFDTTRNLQIMWTGAKYAITGDIDVAIAYYHYIQNSYVSGTTKECSNSSAGKCSGTLDAASAMVDWRFAKKFDTYAGLMFSEVNNGLASGYQTGGHVNIDPTVGLRFKF